ncbi:MAG TPA: LacI family DNA-binding transcriptional regulator [Trebonia sp.]|nr:LacI family DNA-binding transcriptional regulator [Trebonia sp.]
MGRVTSFDVARLAGVSQPTVSRALRDLRGTSKATRARVRDAARALGYVPLQSGRLLSTRLSRRAGIVTGEFGNPFYPALIEPMIAALHQQGYLSVVIPDDDVDALDPVPLVDGSLDGVILTTVHRGSALPAELARHGVPCVLVNRETGEAGADASVAANDEGARQAARFLVGLGHTRIGFIGGLAETTTSHLRRAAFADELHRLGRDLPPRLAVDGRYNLGHGRAGFARVMSARRPPTAVFCANDILALGALEEAHALGLAVPGDVTIVGFDDMPLSALATVGLTTVSVDLAQMGRTAVDLLLTRIASPGLPARREIHPTRLTRRATHAPPPPAA